MKIDKIRQQYDSNPYPNNPIENTIDEDINLLFLQNLNTIYYITKRQVINSEERIILDAGCGTGWNCLALAKANPQAKIIGIDISPKSIDLAQKRLRYHGCENAEFYVLGLEELSSLKMKFDYINCDQVLLFLPDIVTGLKAMKSVLKTTGIIHTNLHSYYQRFAIYRAQKAFSMMGLLETNPSDFEIGITMEIMENLQDKVEIKEKIWNQLANATDEMKKTFILRDFLVQGDRGYTIPEMFAALQQADLEFINMVNWQEWQLANLFQDSDDPLAFMSLVLSEMSVEEQLHLFELLHPVHRLLDFWCTHPGQIPEIKRIEDWEKVQVSLHPQLQTSTFQEALLDSLQLHKSLDLLSLFKGLIDVSLILEPPAIDCLLALFVGKQAFFSLVNRWLVFYPHLDKEEAIAKLQEFLQYLETFPFILLESDKKKTYLSSEKL